MRPLLLAALLCHLLAQSATADNHRVVESASDFASAIADSKVELVELRAHLSLVQPLEITSKKAVVGTCPKGADVPHEVSLPEATNDGLVCIMDFASVSRGFIVKGPDAALMLLDVMILNATFPNSADPRPAPPSPDRKLLWHPTRSLHQTVTDGAGTLAPIPDQQSGAAVQVTGGARLYMRSTYIIGSSASYGAAVAVFASYADAVLSEFIDNEARRDGGAFALESDSVVKLSRVKFCGNRADNGSTAFVGARSELIADLSCCKEEGKSCLDPGSGIVIQPAKSGKVYVRDGQDPFDRLEEQPDQAWTGTNDTEFLERVVNLYRNTRAVGGGRPQILIGSICGVAGIVVAALIVIVASRRRKRLAATNGTEPTSKPLRYSYWTIPDGVNSRTPGDGPVVASETEAPPTLMVSNAPAASASAQVTPETERPPSIIVVSTQASSTTAAITPQVPGLAHATSTLPSVVTPPVAQGPHEATPRSRTVAVLDRMVAQKLLLYDRFRLTGGSEDHRRHGGQALVQFVTDDETSASLAAKFFMQDADFHREKELYEVEALRMAMPDLVHAAEGGLQPTGYGEAYLPPCLIMDRGESMQEFVAAAGHNLLTTVQALGHVAERLGALHLHGWVHRDLKPGNLLWTPSKRCWALLDFGCAARDGQQAGIAYSLVYAAPEVLGAVEQGETQMPVKAAMDMWSFGIIAMEMLAEKPMFPPMTFKQDVVDAVLGRKPMPWEDQHLGPPMLKKLKVFKKPILACLQRDPAKRIGCTELYRQWIHVFESTQNTVGTVHVA